MAAYFTPAVERQNSRAQEVVAWYPDGLATRAEIGIGIGAVAFDRRSARQVADEGVTDNKPKFLLRISGLHQTSRFWQERYSLRPKLFVARRHLLRGGLMGRTGNACAFASDVD
jgi:hypothetical protein